MEWEQLQQRGDWVPVHVGEQQWCWCRHESWSRAECSSVESNMSSTWFAVTEWKKTKKQIFPNCIDYCKRASTICCQRWALWWWWWWCCWCSERSLIIHSILALTEWCQRQRVRHRSPVGFFLSIGHWLQENSRWSPELHVVQCVRRENPGSAHWKKPKLFVWIQRFSAAHRHSGHPGGSWCAWELHRSTSSFSSAVKWRPGAQHHGSWSMWHFTPVPPRPLFLSKDAVWFWLSGTVRLKWKRRPNCRYPVAWQSRATCRYLFWNSLLRREWNLTSSHSSSSVSLFLIFRTGPPPTARKLCCRFDRERLRKPAMSVCFKWFYIFELALRWASNAEEDCFSGLQAPVFCLFSSSSPASSLCLSLSLSLPRLYILILTFIYCQSMNDGCQATGSGST